MKNNNSYLLQEIKQRYPEILEPAREISGKPSYICPVCGNGSGPDATGVQVDPHGDGTQLHCFKCGFHGDILDFYQKVHNCTLPEAIRALAERLAIPADFEDWREPIRLEPVKKTNPETVQAQDQTKEKKDFSEDLQKWRQNLTQYPEALEYLNARGITLATAQRYGIGFDPSRHRIILPTSKNFYTARDTTGTQEPKYLNAKDAQPELFNAAALYEPDAGNVVFITEGIFDALAVIQSGQAAIALNSTSNTRKLVEILQKQKTDNTLVLLLDADTAGNRAAAELAGALQTLEISFLIGSPEILSGGYKDPGQIWQEDRASFLERINDYARRADERASRPDNVSLYLQSGAFENDIKTFTETARKNTGFAELDRLSGGLYAGLYVIGAISSLGKTTLAHQLADQLARAGESVLYFSLEQSRLEMISKSIARETARRIMNRPENLTSLQIRFGNHNEETEKAIETYLREVGDRLSIIEGTFDFNIMDLNSYIERYIKANQKRPIVFVDYLQILQPAPDPTGRRITDQRATIDGNITTLKRISRDYNIPVIVISSLNRNNYLTEIDYESFKESGLIEYTSDVVYGLQLAAIHEELFDKPNKLNEKRNRINTAKDEIPRQIELVCLKNRYGRPHFTVNFEYFPQYELFREKSKPQTKQKAWI